MVKQDPFPLFLTRKFEDDGNGSLLSVQETDRNDVGPAQRLFASQTSGIPSASVTIPTSTPTTSVSSQPSATSAHISNNLAQVNTKSAIVICLIFAAIIFLAILLIIFLIRRRRQVTRRCSFHPEMMIHSHQLPPSTSQTSPSLSCPPASIAPRSQDLEQGIPDPALQPMQISSQDPQPYPSEPIVRPAALILRPSGPRPALRRLNINSPCVPLPALPAAKSLFVPRSPLIPRPPLARSPLIPTSPRLIRSSIPRSPSPRTHRQREIADQIEILRTRMLESERSGEKDGGDGTTPMYDMCKKMAWLREQQEGSWALGLTDVAPLGYDRYMT